MAVLPKFVKAVWKRTSSEGCVSCMGVLDFTINNGGTAGAIRILVEGTGLQTSTKIQDQSFNIGAGSSNSWSFKVPYFADKKPSVSIKTGPAGSVTWTDQKTMTPS